MSRAARHGGFWRTAEPRITRLMALAIKFKDLVEQGDVRDYADYGVLSTVLRQRTAEIGVRVALGAAPSSIFGVVVGHGLALSAAGIAAGLLAALALTTFAVMTLLFFASPL